MVDYTVYSCAVSLIIPRSSIALAIRCQVAIDWRNHPSSDFDVIHILRPPPFSSILFRYRPLLSGSPLSRPLQRNVTSTTSNKPNFGPGSRQPFHSPLSFHASFFTRPSVLLLKKFLVRFIACPNSPDSRSPWRNLRRKIFLPAKDRFRFCISFA